MSRWLDRLEELRSGGSATASDTLAPCSKCSIVQNRSPKAERGEQLNKLNNGAVSARAPGEPAGDCLDAADLLDRYDERAALVRFDGNDTLANAETRAWNEVASLWYRQHGTRTSGDLCAGCGKALGNEANVLLLPHGERAHTDGGYTCIHAYGRRWKGEAAAALAAIGIPTPAEIAVEIDERSS